MYISTFAHAGVGAHCAVKAFSTEDLEEREYNMWTRAALTKGTPATQHATCDAPVARDMRICAASARQEQA